MWRYAIDSIWMIPATASAYLVSGVFFGYSWSDWFLILIIHIFATWVGVTSGPPFYRRWFMRRK
jgi:hypothetical protein